MHLRSAAASFALIALALTGCTGGTELQPGYEEHMEDFPSQPQSEEQLQSEADYFADQQRADDLAVSAWRCYWDPTMNDDWHDDYLCSNGLQYDRPYLLPGDSFVEGWEIDAAAADYEAGLNQ